MYRICPNFGHIFDFKKFYQCDKKFWRTCLLNTTRAWTLVLGTQAIKMMVFGSLVPFLKKNMSDRNSVALTEFRSLKIFLS